MQTYVLATTNTNLYTHRFCPPTESSPKRLFLLGVLRLESFALLGPEPHKVVRLSLTDSATVAAVFAPVYLETAGISKFI